MAPISPLRISHHDRALRSLDQLPPFSPILNRLLATLQREHASIAEIAELIEKDTVLSGNVLRLVNSAAYGRRKTISSIRHAVSIIGIGKLRNIALSLSISRMWTQIRSPQGWCNTRFNLHAIATGLVCDLMAQELPAEYPEGAFVAGLFHDIGRFLIAVGLPDEYEEIEELNCRSGRGLLECEEEVLGITHPELSMAALRRWNLPNPILRAVERHHAEDHRAADETGTLPLGELLRVADLAVDRLGVTIEPPPAEVESPVELLTGVGVQNPAALLQHFYQDFDIIRSSF